MHKRQQIKVDNLARFIVYILGHRPDEFGLVPDGEGFITYKELLWAIHEEKGWGYVRQGHINEVLMGKDRDRFQWGDNRIKALERAWYLDLENPSRSLPKILFIAVRRRAHPHVMEKGLRSIEGKHLVLSHEKEMAVRIGGRRDQRPVLLEIMAGPAQREGILFYAFGDLFLTSEVPPGFISGPPVSKEAVKARGEDAGEKGKILPDFTAGTFILGLDREPATHGPARGKKRKGWKEEARGLRRRKRD